MQTRRSALALLAACATLLACPEPSPDDGPPSGPLQLHMAPDGLDCAQEPLDEGAGTSDLPVGSLECAQLVLERDLAARDRDVEILVAPGTYRDQAVRWHFTMPDHSITIRPLVEATRPVFDGSGVELDSWLYLRETRAEPTNLVIEGLHIRAYYHAIVIAASRDVRGTYVSHNVIRDNLFEDIGMGVWGSDGERDRFGTSAVGLTNSDHNLIENNTFRNILDDVSCVHLHSLYLAHGAESNVIRGNVFENGCGDPIRFRDGSSGNVVEDNTFIDQGIRATVNEWFCDHSIRNTDDDPDNDCTKSSPEEPSWNNLLLDNRITEGWEGAEIAQACSFREMPHLVCVDDPLVTYRDGNTPEAQMRSLRIASSRVYAASDSRYPTWDWTRLNGAFPAQGHHVVGDFDGDGRDDVAILANEDGRTSVRVYPAGPHGLKMSPIIAQPTGATFQTHHRWLAGDADGDGRDDLMLVYGSGGQARLWTWTSDGAGFVRTGSQWLNASFLTTHEWQAGDFDGDGLVDLVLLFSSSGDAIAWTYRSNGSAFSRSATQNLGVGYWDEQMWETGDFDGDGRSDLLLVYAGPGDEATSFTFESRGSSFLRVNFQRHGFTLYPYDQRWRIADLDADGLDDVVVVYRYAEKTRARRERSTGGGFVYDGYHEMQTGWHSDHVWLTGGFAEGGGDHVALVYGYRGAQ